MELGLNVFVSAACFGLRAGLAFCVLDVLWMVLGFAADKANTPALWALIIGTHVLTSYLVSAAFWLTSFKDCFSHAFFSRPFFVFRTDAD